MLHAPSSIAAPKRFDQLHFACIQSVSKMYFSIHNVFCSYRACIVFCLFCAWIVSKKYFNCDAFRTHSSCFICAFCMYQAYTLSEFAIMGLASIADWWFLQHELTRYTNVVPRLKTFTFLMVYFQWYV